MTTMDEAGEGLARRRGGQAPASFLTELAPGRPRNNVVLVGMMGAGKSAVGQALAAKLGWRVVDSDEVVQERAAMSVPELFAARGEDGFRDAESAAINSIGAQDGPIVVSVGGGAVLRERNRDALRRLGTVVWLRAKPATLAARVGTAEGRPVLGREPGALEVRMEKLVSERRQFYDEVADLVVDVDGLSPEEVASLVASELAGVAKHGSAKHG